MIAADRRRFCTRVDWWLPVGDSTLFDGPGAWIYFAVRRAVRAVGRIWGQRWC